MSNAERERETAGRVWQVTYQSVEEVFSPFFFPSPPLTYLTSVQLPLIRAFTDDSIKTAPEPRQLMRCHWQGRSFMHNSICQDLSFSFCLDGQSLFNTLSAFTPVDRPQHRFETGHWVGLSLTCFAAVACSQWWIIDTSSCNEHDTFFTTSISIKLSTVSLSLFS